MKKYNSREQLKIAICFFGITRSLTYTLKSITDNILIPASKVGEVKLFAHYFVQKNIDNERSGEKGDLCQEEYKLLSYDWIKLDLPESFLEFRNYSKLKVYGDAWNDKNKSLKNLLHQLHSLDLVTSKATSLDFDIYIYLRPDLLYHDSLLNPILKMSRIKGDAICTPNWQLADGTNDRFAICRGKKAAIVYGSRISRALPYCLETKAPLHAEKLLKWVIFQSGIARRTMRSRASRVRFDGTIKEEKFDHPILNFIKRVIVKRLSRHGLWKR